MSLSVLALVIFALLPGLASVDEADSFKRRIVEALITEDRRKRRIERNLLRLLGRSDVRKVALYNFENRRELEPFVLFLARHCIQEDKYVSVYLRSGRMERILGLCRQKGFPCEIGPQGNIRGAKGDVATLLRTRERYALSVLAAFGCALPLDDGERHVVSVELAESFLAHGVPDEEGVPSLSSSSRRR